MRILLVHPGPAWSTADVWSGLRAALVQAGCAVDDYRLDTHLALASEWLQFGYERARMRNPDVEQPNYADLLYHAGQGILAAALRAPVDAVLVVSAQFLHPDWLVLLQRAGVPVGVLLTESPYDDEQQAAILPWVTHAWTFEPASLPFLREANPRVSRVSPAYDPRIHHPGPPAPDTPRHDVLLVGTGWPERVRLLEAIDWTGVDLALYGNWDVPDDSPLAPAVHPGPIPNDQAADLYRAARINLNVYRATDRPAVALNPRAVELAACGAFTISSDRQEVRDTFGAYVPCFRTAEELELLIRFWLPLEEQRRAIAARLPQRVTGRTFTAMASEILAGLADDRSAAATGLPAHTIREAR